MASETEHLAWLKDKIAKYFGERCEDCVQCCPCCEAWTLYDIISDAPQLQSRGVLSNGETILVHWKRHYDGK